MSSIEKRCRICGKRLSLYNNDEICWKHERPRDYSVCRRRKALFTGRESRGRVIADRDYYGRYEG